MADTNYTLNGVTGSATNMTATIELTQRTDTIIKLDTDKKYLEKDIWLTLNAKSASPTFKGGAVSGTATATGTNCSIDTSNNNSGVLITAQGSAIREKVQYNSAVDGWVTENADADAYAASSATNLTETLYYINGVTLAKPNQGEQERTFSITVPNGDNNTITFVFHVDSNGNVTVTE